MDVLAERDGEKIIVTTAWHHSDLIKAIPGASWSRADDRWTLPLAWTACLALRETFGESLVIGPDLLAWATAHREKVDKALALRDATEAGGYEDLYPFQRAGVSFIEVFGRALIWDDPGCLIGNTEVIVNRGGCARRMTLEELYSRWTRPVSARYSWKKRPDVRTAIKSLHPDGTLRLNDVVDVVDKGVRPVMTMTLASGKKVTCTYDHEINTGSFDSWVEAGKLSIGDQVAINGTPACMQCGSPDDVIDGKYAKWRGYCTTCMYRYKRRDKHNLEVKDEYRILDGKYWHRGKQWGHPNANARGWIPEHVLVATEAAGRSLRPGEHVHHKNEDTLDNRPENLAILTASEHTRHHGVNGGFLHLNGGSGKRGEIWFIPKLDTVVALEPAGEQRVYDLVMADPARNFVANGVVVHNSGKTVQAIRALSHMHAGGTNVFPVLVTCPNSMKRTWKREFEKWWPGVECSVVSGTALQRRKALAEPAHVYIINIESLRAHSRLAPFGSIALKRCRECGGQDAKVTANACEVHQRELNKMDFQTVIADECFTAGVKVETPNGSCNIENLKTGDIVWGYDHTTNTVVKSRITATMQRKSSSVLPGWNVTPNHPVYVVDAGYRAVGDLAGDDLVYAYVPGSYLSGLWPTVQRARSVDTAPEVLLKTLQRAGERAEGLQQNSIEENISSEENLRAVWCSLSTSVWKNKDTFLFSQLCSKNDCGQAGNDRASFCTHAKESSRRDISSSASDSCACPVRREPVQDDGPCYPFSRREARLAKSSIWDEHQASTYQPRSNATFQLTDASPARVYGSLFDTDRNRAANSVSGYCVSRSDARSGGRRWRAPELATPLCRCTSNRSTHIPGMDGHPLLELRNPQRYEEVCREGAVGAGETVDVYSITTETGNYFANGVLVRNCHRFKNASAKQTRALWAATGDAPVRIGLTGTPIANNVIDLWATLHWLNPNEWPSKTKFIDRFVDVMLNAFGGLVVLGVKPRMMDEFYAGINPYTRRMPKELVLKHLPPIVYERRDVEMNARQKKAYRQMQDDLIAELDGGLLTVGTDLIKSLRLLQIASSYAEVEYTPDVDEHGRPIQKVTVKLTEPSNKIDAFVDDIEDFGDDGVAVMAVSRQLIDLLSARLTKLKIPHGIITGEISEFERQQHIDDFQAGKTKFILFTAAAGGVGITLTAARYLVRLQRPWSRVDDVQALNRVHRIGSERHDTIIVIDYISEGTIEERVLKRLAEKGEYFEELVRDRDLLRHLIKDDEE